MLRGCMKFISSILIVTLLIISSRAAATSVTCWDGSLIPENGKSCPLEPALPLDKTVTVDCSGFSGRTEIMELQTHTSCGHPDTGGMLHISPDTMKHFDTEAFKLRDPEWHSDGLRCMYFRLSDGTGGFGFLTTDGRARISTFPHDNGCQPFGNDVAISYVDGEAIFFDRNLHVVKSTEYELADPFFKHLAKVCIVAPKKEYHGEHFKWVGGQCGFIDTDFNEVVPILSPYEKTRRLTGGKYDGIELDQWDAPVLEFLLAHMEEPFVDVEAVFRPQGCQLDYCSDERKVKLDLPEDLDEGETWIKIIRFRLEDQTLWEGQVLSDRTRHLTLHRLHRISSLAVQ